MKYSVEHVVDLQKRLSAETGRHLFEDLIKKIYTRIIQPGELAIDGGANVGFHTFPLSDAVGRTGQVLAFEALPNLVDYLKDQVKKRNVKNIQLYQKALSSETGKVHFHWVKDAEAMSGIRMIPEFLQNRNAVEHVENFEVEAVMLDTFVERFQLDWRFAKLDLEGGEFFALKGARRSLTKFQPMIIFENSRQPAADAYGYTKEEWFDFFASTGYRVYDILGQPFTVDEWFRFPLPWYVIAVGEKSADEYFVRDELPELVDAVVEEFDVFG